MTFDEVSASDAQKFLAPPKRRIRKNRRLNCRKKKLGHRKMKCRESSETHFPKVSRGSEPCSRGKWPFKVWKKYVFLFVFGDEKWNVGNRLKRAFAKFCADRSHPRGVMDRSKFAPCSRYQISQSPLKKISRSLLVLNKPIPGSFIQFFGMYSLEPIFQSPH